MGLPHVTKVQQRGDNTISVYIETDNFKPGQEVEVSAYLTQGETYAVYNDKKRIPLPDLTHYTDPAPPTVLHVELPATELDPHEPVTVVTRVTEVWSTFLPEDPDTLKQLKVKLGEYADQGLKAAWKYPDSEGNGPGGRTTAP